MSTALVEFKGVGKRYPFFALHDIDLQIAPGQVIGFIGPNGAGKSTTIRILMGLITQDRGVVRVLGRSMPAEQSEAKRDVGFVSEEMRLYGSMTLEWHMRFVASVVPHWDSRYAEVLLDRFNLQPKQQTKSLSHGQRMKAMLLLALARRPRLLVLDEPMTGLDPVARQEILAELIDVVVNEERSVLFSSHSTQDVEQISDHITFIDRGRIIESSDKEAFLDRWRRLHAEVPAGRSLPQLPGVVDVTSSGRLAVITTKAFSPDLPGFYEQAGARIREVQHMTLEEIFVAEVMSSRKEKVA
jgi:ABC-2 type transport system ATP-binding protein